MKITNLCFVLILLFCTHSFSQNQQKQIQDFKIKTNAEITHNKDLSGIRFVSFPSNNPLELTGKTLNEKVNSFLSTYKDVYSIDFQTDSFASEKLITDNYGLKHIKINQLYNNVPVFGGKLIFHFNISNKLTSVNGNFISDIHLNTTPNITDTHARQAALQMIKGQNINYSGEHLFVNKSKLYVFERGLIQSTALAKNLVYEVEVRNDYDVREFVFIDAHSGKIIEQYTGIAHAIDRVLYEVNTSTTAWAEGDALPGTLDIWQQNQLYTAEHTYNFFKNAFGYVSFDGADGQMKTVNNAALNNCPNANWNGNSTNYCPGTASDDVVGHEWAHAYTEYTNGLIYAWQSGAINESYSDIWGETIDLLNGYEDLGEDLSLRTGCQSSDRWRMGEDALAFSNPIRDMWDPNCNNHPGKVSDIQYSCGTDDSGGVHRNSGIPNHAYALLVDGGIYNGQTINAIGFTKAAHIFWRAQSQYLTTTSDFNDLADALEASANDLINMNLEGLSTTITPFGVSGELISAADAAIVAQVILAVEMRTEPTACGFTAMLSETANLCSAATNNPIFIENWESGIGSWSVTQLPVNPGTWDSREWSLVNTLPLGRTGSAMFGIDPIIGGCSSGDLENGIIRLESPIITIPNYVSGNFEMAFNHNVSTEQDWDGGNIKYKINSGAWEVIPAAAFITNPYNGVLNGGGNDNPMATEEAFTGSDGGTVSGSWGTSVINLSSLGVLANNTVQFRWELGTDGCNGRVGWYLDEIIVYNCDFTLETPEIDEIVNNIKLYPNPSKGVFNLKKTGLIELIKAEIHDINGRIIQSIDLSTMNETKAINLYQVTSGLYFMTLTSQEAKTVIKLIKE